MKNPCLSLKSVKFFLLLLFLPVLLGGCGFFSRGETGAAAAQTAKRYLGVPYKLGGKTPGGFDCSGLTSYVYKRNGVALPRSSRTQAKVGKPVKKPLLKPGDLVFFATGKTGVVSHVGIYIGGGQFIHAPGLGKRVCKASMNAGYFQKTYHSARRVAI